MVEGWYRIVQKESGGFDVEYFVDGVGIHQNIKASDLEAQGYLIEGPLVILTQDEMVQFVNEAVTFEMQGLIAKLRVVQKGMSPNE